ncbi:sensor histidine kinase [Rhodoferax sp.]|uniref:sensor histidine kinase n=1 Tax=Rhodoferax sp. TaxID=50421 RepID=UPI00261DD04F|nr:sensor histidine kinase [Rhodoferax sp.]MDD2808603.1 sensor histidine kinase N-terminal domain-containing protein [Rhodoferax sp.]MDD4943986.1 sensor histidine kinase N-terminal domain-containing protein [Rhodoferax sp.]
MSNPHPPSDDTEPAPAGGARRGFGLHRLRRLSLRRTLLLVLLPGMLLVMGLEIVVSWRTALAAANAAYDRSLLGAIKAMDANISTASGGLSVELPYRMLEFFELTANGRVFYRVASGDGLVEIGNADLPGAPRPLVNGQPQFSDALYYGEPIRLGSYARALARPLSSGSNSHQVVIQIGETLESRQDFTRQLVMETVARDLLLLLAGLALLVLAVNWSLRPLQRLRQEVLQRDPQDLTPLDAHHIAQDVQPLVEAINHHVMRYREAMQARRSFIDDASHQLRTPLTTLSTQVSFALREPDAALMKQALVAIKLQVDDTVRQTNQMLALARADTLEWHMEPCDLIALAQAVTRAAWPDARSRHIDLGFEPLGNLPAEVSTHAGLLKEALTNLLHNALHHTPPGSKVTVQAGIEQPDLPALSPAQAVLRVIDNGPGMTSAELARAGERFYRGSAQSSGSGLGLAIAKAIVQRHGGDLSLRTTDAASPTPGLTVTLHWPL